MNNKIEVNEYVRTPIGIFIISHINIDFDDNDKNKCLLCQNEKVLFLSIETIKSLKHSKQLIDLIEVGDVVNKLEIFRVAEYNENYDAKVVYHETDEEAIPIATDEIETVLTHEQYEANCYKVGGEDE